MARILVTSLFDLSVKGGLSGNLRLIGEALREGGHSATLVGFSTGEPAPLPFHVIAPRVNRNVFGIVKGVLLALKFIWAKPDALLLTQAGSPFTALLAGAAALAHVPLVYIAADSPIETIENVHGRTIGAWILTTWLRFSLPFVDRIACATLSVSPGIEDLFRGRGWRGEMRPFYNVHNADVEPLESIAPFRRGSGWKDAFVIIYQGALQRTFRGIEQQLEATAIARRSGCNVRFVAIGYGDAAFIREYARELGISDVILLLPEVDPRILRSWLMQADLAAGMDLWYGLTSKTLEYISAGLVVLVPDYSRDVLNVCRGYVSAFGTSSEELADRIVELAKRKDVRPARTGSELISALRRKSVSSVLESVTIALRSNSSQRR